MTKYILFLLTLCLITISCTTTKITGKYQTNFPTYGRFAKLLTINCDSTFTLNFSGDFINDNSYGKWSIRNDSLILLFNSNEYTKSRYQGTNYYLIKRNKLSEYFPISKEKYDELILLVEKEGLTDSLKLGDYRKFKRTSGKTFKNFQGKMGKQYFKKIEKFDCEK